MFDIHYFITLASLSRVHPRLRWPPEPARRILEPMPEITSRLSTALADRYKIERHLGEGGMATVYLAEDLKHHRKVAVKVLRPELAAVQRWRLTSFHA